MKVTHIKKDSIVPSQWSGGATYEYLIFPSTSTYIARDFDFRISSASIDDVPSVFTTFNNYQRYLVMLDGSLDCVRNEVKEYYAQHELFSFKSSDVIESYSKGNDFNLMIREDIAAEVKVYRSLDTIKNSRFCLIYALQEGIISIQDVTYAVEIGDCLFIQNQKLTPLNLVSLQTIVFGFWK